MLARIPSCAFPSSSSCLHTRSHALCRPATHSSNRSQARIATPETQISQARTLHRPTCKQTSWLVSAPGRWLVCSSFRGITASVAGQRPDVVSGCIVGTKYYLPASMAGDEAASRTFTIGRKGTKVQLFCQPTPQPPRLHAPLHRLVLYQGLSHQSVLDAYTHTYTRRVHAPWPRQHNRRCYLIGSCPLASPLASPVSTSPRSQRRHP